MKKRKKKTKKNNTLLISIIISAAIITCAGSVCTVYTRAAEITDYLKTPVIGSVFKEARGYISGFDLKKAISGDVLTENPGLSTEPEISPEENEFPPDMPDATLTKETDTIETADEPPAEITDLPAEPEAEIEETAELPRSFMTVTDDYFNDALFVGDSRMVGLSEYCEAIDTRADFYVKKALTIFNLLDGKAIKSFDGTQKTLWEVLEEKQYGKIYIMVGINEIGVGTPSYFAESYSQVIDKIRESQPDALIFINSIMHVTGSKSNSDPLYNNTNVNARNEAIMPLADNIHIFYLDVNEAVDDENGDLRSDLSFDDVHLKGSSYEPWHEYLLSHGIN